MAIDLANITADQWKEGMGETQPGATVTTTTTPEPAKEEVSRGTSAQPDSSNAQQAEGRARNPDGTFAPKAGDAAPEPAPKAAPFDGFDKLDPNIQREYTRLLGERDDFKLRYTRLNGEYRRVTRQQNGSGREAQPGVTPRSGANTQVGQAADQVRSGAQNLAPNQRAQVERQIDAWKTHAQQYPDDAKAIEQRLGLLQDEIRQQVTTGITGPILQNFQQFDGRVSKLEATISAFEEERHSRHMEDVQRKIEEVGGDNFRQVFGMEDADGRPIPEFDDQGNRQWDWHPEFVAWIEGHDPDLAADLWRQVAESKSPTVIGNVVGAFNRDKFAMDNGGAPTPQPNPRADNLRDVAPNTRGTAMPQPSGTQNRGPGTLQDLAQITDHAEWKRRMAEA